MWWMLIQEIDEMAEALVALIATFTIAGFVVAIALTVVLVGYLGLND